MAYKEELMEVCTDLRYCISDATGVNPLKNCTMKMWRRLDPLEMTRCRPLSLGYLRTDNLSFSNASHKACTKARKPKLIVNHLGIVCSLSEQSRSSFAKRLHATIVVTFYQKLQSWCSTCKY